MSKGAFGLVAAAAVVALLVAGCGGGGDSADLTKAEYVKKGNTICKKAEEERFAIFEEESQKLSPKEEREREKQEEVLLAGMRSYERAIEKLDELGLPAGSEEKAESLLGSMEEAFERVQQDPGTVLVSDAPFKKANEEAESLGLDNCVT